MFLNFKFISKLQLQNGIKDNENSKQSCRQHVLISIRTWAEKKDKQELVHETKSKR